MDRMGRGFLCVSSILSFGTVLGLATPREVDAACPPATGNQLIDWALGQGLTSMPTKYGIDISGSTTSQDSYNVVWSTGTTSLSYPWVYNRLYSTTNHALSAYGFSNTCNSPNCVNFVGARTDNLNLLGIFGAWINGWSTKFLKGGSGNHYYAFTRDFASDLTPYTPDDTVVLIDLEGEDRYSFVDVAALPGLSSGVVLVTPDSSNGVANYVRMAYVDSDGSVSPVTPLVSQSTSTNYYYPTVTGSVSSDQNYPVKMVATWTDTTFVPAYVYFRVYGYSVSSGELEPLSNVVTVGRGSLSEVAAVPDGFVVTWLSNFDTSRQVIIQSYDWNGTPLFPDPIVVSSVTGEYSDPAIAGAMWQIPGGSLQPY